MLTDLFSNSTAAVFALILGFGFLIFIHELGHFAVAKWVGIRATQFAIGFGQALVSYRKGLGVRVGGTEKEYIARALDALKEEGKSIDGLDEHARNQMIMEKADALGLGETEYRLNWMPLGGYVKMLGQEDMDPAAQSDDPRSFNKKSIGARAAVISAGVIMNLIFGLIFFIICFQMGVKFAAPVVGDVQPGSPAAVTFAKGHEGNSEFRGLEPGDTITHINGKPITDMTEVRIATALGKGGRPVEMTVDRPNLDQPLIFDIVATASEANEGLLSAGIMGSQSLTIGENQDGSASVVPGLEFAGQELLPGMTLSLVNGKPIQHISEYRTAVAEAGQQPYTATFVDDQGAEAKTLTLRPTPTWDFNEADQRHLLGLVPGVAVYIEPGSPAEKAGLQHGDVLKKIGNVEWPTTIDEIVEAVGYGEEDGVPVEVLRRGETVVFAPILPEDSKLGINMRPPHSDLTLFAVLPDSPLAQATDEPIHAGSRLVSVNGTSIGTWADVQHQLQSAASDSTEGVEIALGIQINVGDQPTETHVISLTPEQAQTVAALDLQPAYGASFENLMVEVKADGPIDATMIGIDKTGQFIQQTYITLLRLVQGTIGVKNLRGPVGIVDEGAQVAARGFAYYLFFLGLISINLAVLNFLPIPIVDGGLMVFLMIEKIKGSPASPKVQVAVSLVGLVGLACVFLYVTFNDISRIVTG